MGSATSLSGLRIILERDLFLRSLIRELGGVLEDLVGFEEASGYISLVGRNIGKWIDEIYKRELGVGSLSREQTADVLVDLKARIMGEFSVLEQNDERIVLRNSACPFGDKVLDRPSLCMMTSNVFGVIAAENLGYAKVVLEKTIAKKDGECRVVVYLKPSPEADAAQGREYFRTEKEGE